MDWGLLQQHRDEVLAFDAVPAPMREHQAKRLELDGVPLDDLWEQFLARAREVRNKYLGKFDLKVHERLIEAMARRHPREASERAMAFLPGCDESVWLEISCADLLAATRYRPAVPALMDSLSIDADLLPDRAWRALARTGDADVVRRIEAFFPTTVRRGRLYAPEALGGIKLPESEAALVRLIKSTEDDEEILTILGGALIDRCPTEPEALEVLRQMVAEKAYDPAMGELDERMLTIGKMVGYDPPEAPQRRKAVAGRGSRMPDPESAYKMFGKLFEWDEGKGEIDEVDVGAGGGGAEPKRPPVRAASAERPEAAEAFPALPPSDAALLPFRRIAPKVGRNDPCPCGSGRKYKKCCMGKEAAG